MQIFNNKKRRKRKKSERRYEESEEKTFYVLAGAITGVVNGLFGGGGGMVLVPALVFLSGTEVKKAHATAVAAILPVSMVSAAVYFFSGQFPLADGLPTSLGVAAGGIAGALLLGKLKPKKITLIFSLLMLFAGLKIFL